MTQNIYMITNLKNGKRYIGQNRNGHSWYMGSGTAIKKAILKHGRKSFKKEILIKGSFDNELLNLLEVEAIEKYRTYAGDYPKTGYNLNIGGLEGSIRKIISRGTRAKLRLNSSTNKKVHKYTIKGVYCKSYDSLAEAARKNGMIYTAISNAIKSNGQAGKFQWRTEKVDELPAYDLSLSAKKAAITRLKPINMFTMNGEFVRTFPSIRDAAIETGLTRSGINQACIGTFSSSNGYKWAYAQKSANEGKK